MKMLGPFGTNSRIGFVGLGVMGGGMAHCLLRKGFALQIYALNPQISQPFVEAGATAATSAAALASSCDLVFLSLPDAAVVEEVLFGPQGLAKGLAPGSCVVDTSTIAATSARAVGERLREQGVWFMDAPVSGGQQGALDGVLTCMVGGPPSWWRLALRPWAAFARPSPMWAHWARARPSRPATKWPWQAPCWVWPKPLPWPRPRAWTQH